jgi:hypothetical protein
LELGPFQGGGSGTRLARLKGLQPFARHLVPGSVGDQPPEACPIECRARIGFSARGDILVTGEVGDRVTAAQRPGESGQDTILGSLVVQRVGAFQLDADGEIVALLPAPPRRSAGMPRPAFAGYKLRQRAVAPDQEMRGNPQLPDRGEVGMRAGVETVGEQLRDRSPPELTRRQGNVMHHEQRDLGAGWAIIAIGRGQLYGGPHLAGAVDHKAADGCDQSTDYLLPNRALAHEVVLQ